MRPLDAPLAGRQFAIFRFLFGLYLSVHFLRLLPYGTELFSREGVLADPSLNFTHGAFPNLLEWIDDPTGVAIFLISLSALSAVLALGLVRRTASLLLWYGWACLFHRNNFIDNPFVFFGGWLLLVCAVVPRGEPLSWPRHGAGASWRMPAILYGGAWLVLALSYSVSGLDKLLTSPSWRSGEALRFVMESPLARDTVLRELFLELPASLVRIGTWLALATEAVFAPLCLFHRTRALAWCAATAMHLAILCLIDFEELTLGMLLFHLFVFDARWIPIAWRPSRADDGAERAHL